MRLWLLPLLLGQALHVGPGAEYATIAGALADARAGDTVRVAPGVYRERLVVEHPVVLIGGPGVVIDGEGRGTVVTLLARATLQGFVIRGSGASLDREDAGIMVRADSCVISGNTLEDVLFGIYLKGSNGNAVTDNRITGKDRPLGRRGDGIRLWYSHDDRFERNSVRRTRDVVIYFSHGLRFRKNRIESGRYGLHYMYSDHNLFEWNEFVDNDVGAFLMYSSDIALRHNVFSRAGGSSGFGIGLKDADRIDVADNLIVQNQVGIYLDNSPHAVEVRNSFRGNTIAYNDAAISPLPSVHDNDFVENTFTGNVRDVTVSGGGTAMANVWRGNFWDKAAAWDPDEDGVADVPRRIDRLSDDLFARHPRLRLYELSPAALALDALGRFFPLLEPQPIVVDSAPRTSPVPLAWSQQPGPGEASEGTTDHDDGPRPLQLAFWLVISGTSLWGAWRWRL